MMKNEKSYVIIPNVAFGFGTKYHLNKDEMMVFAHLQMMKQIGLVNTTITMVEVLVATLGWETTNKSRDKKNLAKALVGLQAKGYIKIECDGEIVKSILTITINKEMEKDFEVTSSVDWKDNPFVFKGFTRVDYEQYNLAENNGYKMIIIAYIKWRTNKKLKFDYKICFKEWEMVLGVTDKTAREILSNCASFINKESGAGYTNDQGQPRRKTNSYNMKSDTNGSSNLEKETAKGKVESILDKAYTQVTDEKVFGNPDIFHQIFDKKKFIKIEGYKVWKETSCDIVKKAGQDKIDSMRASKNKIAGEVVDRLEGEYQEGILHKEQQKALVERQTSAHEYEEFTSSYIKREKSSSDISIFLDD